MSNDAFDAKILLEKLSKLNNSQQSIESLSRWCISHRRESRQIVESWEKMFKTSQKEQCVSFLYLANDILQNSRRKGSEFVNEFWKVLPAALKHAYDNGDESGKKAATRLVDIWEERKVFGSCLQSLKDELIVKQGKKPAPQVVSNGKSTNPIKIVKKDAQSLRIKLVVGGFPERILSAYHFIHDECSTEDSAMANCSAAALSVERTVKELESSVNQGILPDYGITDEMQDQENVLQQCVKQLEGAESSRVALVALLKEALLEQETKLESLRSQLQIAHDRINDVEHLKPKLTMQNHVLPAPVVGALTEPLNLGELSKLSAQAATSLQVPASQPITSAVISGPLPIVSPATSFASLAASEEESKKAAAAAVAAKLAASTSSAQMLTSVLSSLVAEEAASLNDNLRKVGFAASLPMFSPEKRQKVEHPSSAADVANTEPSSSPYFTPLRQPISSMPMSVSQANQMPTSVGPPPPPPPPPPPLMPGNPASNQFVQSAGMMLNMMPYGYGGGSLPPPPPLPSHLAMGLARPPNPQSPQPLQRPQQRVQQQNASGGFYQPPGIGLYGSSSQPSTPPVQRQ